MLTGADWQASGWGDLPVAGGMKRRGGAASYRPRFPALVTDRVRWVGDYVAFVVAETKHQAADAAELIEVEYEPLPAIVSTEGAVAPGAPLVWDDCPDNICFVHEVGDKAAVAAAFAGADRVVKRRIVINRVTAAAMEPRGAIGEFNQSDGRFTIYTTLQRTHAYRADLAQILKVAESRVRVVCRRHRRQLRHEIGNLQRGRAGAPGSQAGRPAGQVDQHPLGSLPLGRAGARPCHRG